MSKSTALYELHKKYDAKMVDFAGYRLPVSYTKGLIAEHEATRSGAGIFDVSHMGQVWIEGDHASKVLEALMPSDLESLKVDHQVYSVLTNESGGIIDDLIVTRRGENAFSVVLNAACKENDIAHLTQYLNKFVQVVEQKHLSLIAVQGPSAEAVLAPFFPGIESLVFMQCCAVENDFGECYVSRSGYTGEDGFEISIHNDRVDSLVEALLQDKCTELVGLGARDSLRLEAGLCLYGQDITSQTSPIEAGLNFAIAKSRRIGQAKSGGFLGSDIVLEQMESGVKQKRVGLRVEGKLPVRAKTKLENTNGGVVGEVTSGSYCPTLKAPAAMGYVDTALSSLGTQLFAVVRNKRVPVAVEKLPFIEPGYRRAK